jgi:hypothetical protein
VIITTAYFDDLVLAALNTHLTSGGYSGPLFGMNLALFDNNILLTSQTSWSQLVECIFSGYARKTGVVFSAPILQGDNTYSVLSNLYTWIAQAQSNFQIDQAYGWALIDNSNPPNLLMAELFAQQQPFTAPNDGFGLVITFNFGKPNIGSFGTVVA